jgi:hypothetical protein
MTREEVMQVYVLVTTSYRQQVRKEELEAWHALLGPTDLPAGDVMAAATRLCLEPRTFPPTVGEVYAAAVAVSSPPVPSMDAAIGHYLAGNWDAHPAIREAARAVWWDRRMAEAQAVRQFRQLYTAATETSSPSVDRAGGSPAPVAEIGHRVVAELEGP